jgi:hypothetical protein
MQQARWPSEVAFRWRRFQALRLPAVARLTRVHDAELAWRMRGLVRPLAAWPLRQWEPPFPELALRPRAPAQP